jgi:hypothetical protein
MDFYAWIPGFIPELVKAGQLLLAVGLGFALGNIKREAFPKAILLGGAFLFAGLLCALFLSSSFITLSLLALTLLSGCLVAAVINRPSVIYMMAALGGAGLGASFLPQAGQFPSNVVLITANVIGVSLVVGGAALMSYWAFQRQSALWPKIGVRILGSWLLAISALMLALELAGMGSL